MKSNGGYFKAPETEFLLQWGNRKRLRGPRVKDLDSSEKINGGIRQQIRSRNDRSVAPASASDEKETSQIYQPSSRFSRNCEGAVLRSNARENNRKSSSPEEKDDRHYTTRGSAGSGGSGSGENDNGKLSPPPPADGNRCGGGVEKKRGGGGVIWPKVYISLSSKEKEEDFMAMKGCKPSHMPKKRPKMIQRSLLDIENDFMESVETLFSGRIRVFPLIDSTDSGSDLHFFRLFYLVSPGGWLSDMSYERYEVKEKKTSKKKPRGLKAMGSMDSDSD